MPSIDAVCGCEITRADRRQDLRLLKKRLKETKLLLVAVNTDIGHAWQKPGSAWQLRLIEYRDELESRIAALRAEMEASDAT